MTYEGFVLEALRDQDGIDFAAVHSRVIALTFDAADGGFAELGFAPPPIVAVRIPDDAIASALKTLEDSALVRGWWGDDSETRNDVRNRHYALTDAGRQLLTPKVP